MMFSLCGQVRPLDNRLEKQDLLLMNADEMMPCQHWKHIVELTADLLEYTFFSRNIVYINSRSWIPFLT